MAYKFIILNALALFLAESDGDSSIPVISLNAKVKRQSNTTDFETLKYLPFIMLIDKDTSEYWRETEILSLVRNKSMQVDQETCPQTSADILRIPSRRSVRTVCRNKIDYQLCPQCPQFNNKTECELFRDSCRERKVQPSEYNSYCDRKYGKWRAKMLPADYSQCRCCDECIFYREMDQSCMHDENDFEIEEFLPTTSIDFRAGCNPYEGHKDQESLALRCDTILRRCVPTTMPTLPKESITFRRSYRYKAPGLDKDCPTTCRGYQCSSGLVRESGCPPGAFLPDEDHCNCCGRCSAYYQLNQKCAEFKKTLHDVNGSTEMEVEEEFLEPGCDDGLVCREGICQDIHSVHTSYRRKNDDDEVAREPCKQELKYFKKKYGENGHLHYDAPQCTPLWLYAPIQCRRFLCYCALEDGTRIQGVKVPRVEVSNMNCDCAREKCRQNPDLECDGYGNYYAAAFVAHQEEWTESYEDETTTAETFTEEVLKPTKTLHSKTV